MCFLSKSNHMAHGCCAGCASNLTRTKPASQGTLFGPFEAPMGFYIDGTLGLVVHGRERPWVVLEWWTTSDNMEPQDWWFVDTFLLLGRSQFPS